MVQHCLYCTIQYKINQLHLYCSSETFDIDKLKRTSKLFIGKHDFRSFMKYSKEEKTVSIRSVQQLFLAMLGIILDICIKLS